MVFVIPSCALEVSFKGFNLHIHAYRKDVPDRKSKFLQISVCTYTKEFDLQNAPQCMTLTSRPGVQLN